MDSTKSFDTQDLKDFARRSGVDVVYSEVARERDGRGMVEFETAEDLKTAVRQLDNTDFKGNLVKCVPDLSAADNHERRRSASPRHREFRHSPGPRARSPPGRYPRERSPGPAPRGGREYARERSPRGRPEPYGYYDRRDRDRESYTRGSHGSYNDDGYPPPAPKREYDERYGANTRSYGDRRVERSPGPRSPRPRYPEEEYRRRY